MGAATTGESIGQRIRRLRTERGLSQRDIEGVGADHAHISRVERGQRAATDAFLRTAARNLGVSVSYLRHGEGGSAEERRRARLDDLELTLRIETGMEVGAVIGELRALHAEAVAAGDFGFARRSRALIGCSASEHGQHGIAVRELSRLVDEQALSPVAESEVYLCLGRSLAAIGRADEAVSLFESCLASLRWDVPEDAVPFVRFSTYLSYALSDAGELWRAKEVLRRALAAAESVRDAMTRIRLYFARARLAWAECDWEQGRACAERAILLLETSEDSQDLLRMHLLLADIGLLTGDLDCATASLSSAKELVSRTVDAQDAGFCLRVEAFVAAHRGDGESATRLAGEALVLLGEDAAERGRAYWALAEGLVAQGEDEPALEAFRQAYELMLVEKRFLPQLLHAWLSTLRRLGRPEEACEVMLQALESSALGPASLV